VPNYWLAFGKPEQWASALAYSRWGVKEMAQNGAISSPARDWDRVKKGDIIIFVTKNTGVRGWGIIEGKDKEDTRWLWPDEVDAKAVIYKRRLIIFIVSHDGSARHRKPISLSSEEVEKLKIALRTDPLWYINSNKIKNNFEIIADLNPPFGAGLIQLYPQTALKILKKVRDEWMYIEGAPSIAKIRQFTDWVTESSVGRLCVWGLAVYSSLLFIWKFIRLFL